MADRLPTKQPRAPFRLLESQPVFYSQLAADIGKAEKSVDLAFFVFESDKTTQPIFREIEEAARRNVHVRIVVDHIGNIHAPFASRREFRRLTKLQKEGLKIEVKHARQKKDSLNPLRRDHKKIVAIDAGTNQEVGYIGGSNVSGRFLKWRDYIMRTTGQPVEVLAADFQKTWEGTNNGSSHYVLDAKDGTEMLFDSKKTDTIIDRVIKEIGNAKERIWMETSYLDSHRVKDALILAKKQNPNLDVRLLIPDYKTSNDFRFRYFPNHWTRPFINAGIDVREYTNSKHFTHAKTLLIDDLALTGSSNFVDDMVVGGDAEVVLLSKNPQYRRLLQEWFLGGWEHATPYK
ncbi:MAG TPA: phosphatidylserine/phosphatidylglycerophosphate/cardiolipin synthase family protein [Patescibacteria group bacterium]|nr:phosphatidylserine/phosphatidylglycerophosphate/cardiolipin synthase family protein [Patescibacteria group bacterium]